MRCPHCRAQINGPASDQHGADCPERTKYERVCPRCGQPKTRGFLFCGLCEWRQRHENHDPLTCDAPEGMHPGCENRQREAIGLLPRDYDRFEDTPSHRRGRLLA